MGNVYLTVTKHNLVVEAPYKEAFREELKDVIDPIYRAWDKDKKVWLVGKQKLPVVKELLKFHYPHERAYLIEGSGITDLHTGEEADLDSEDFENPEDWL